MASIRRELDRQYRKDLNKLMKEEWGRRIFSYLQMTCGVNESRLEGDTTDIFNAGRRSVATELQMAVDSIDWPHRTSGAYSRLLAEKEYIDFQLSVKDELERKERALKEAQK